jgi:hypothetical protein
MTSKFSSTSIETTLQNAIATSGATSMTVASGTGSALMGGVTLAAGNVDVFTVAIDVDTINEEIVFITNQTSDTMTIVRGQAGTSPTTHSAGATVKHVLTSYDLTNFQATVPPYASLAFSGSTSGTTTIQATAVAGTNTLTLPATNSDTLVGKATSDVLTNKTINVASNTLTGVATLTGTETLTSKTLTAPIVVSPEERTTISATAATGTVNFDASTQGTLYYTTNASANWTLNVRGNSGTTLNSIMTTGDSLTITFLATQGSTAYYASALTIDGTSVTPKYQGGTAWSSGNASSIDAYTYAIVKTGSAAYTVFASQTKFA